MKNKVLESTRFLVENPMHVRIDRAKLEETAEQFSKEELEMPSWDAPVFPEKSDELTIDFFLLGNAINFAYTDFKTGEKYSAEYKGSEWKGAFGMWACLKRALEEGIPILDASFLKNVSDEEVKEIFRGNIEIPLLKERSQIFREVGKVLSKKYSGSFHNLIKASNQKLFDDGKGIVERLTNEFESFDDSTVYEGNMVSFDKRSQLGPGMLYGRFRNKGAFVVQDIGELTVFADYVLPKALRDLGILVYEPSLAKKVDNRELITAESREELEIRASTLHACNGMGIEPLKLDYRLWKEARKNPGYHHLTITTAY